MKTCLAYTSPARGHLYPIVPTLLELAARGHEVHVRTLREAVPALRDAGLHAEPIDREIEAVPLDDWKADSPEEAIGNIMAVLARRAELELPDLRRALDTLDPDLLLVDITTAGAAAGAEASGIPWARWIPYFNHFDFGSGPQAAFMPYAVHPLGLEVLNSPRDAAGLTLLESVDDAWSCPLHLYLTAPPFEPGVAMPESVRAIGPGVWEPPAKMPEGVDRLSGDLVLVTASSEFQRDSGLVEAALAALAGENVGVAASTAAHDATGVEVPGNAHVARWLPHGALLERAACVVCHGGMGITQKALAAGVPVCVVPFGRDQFDVAERVVAARAGTRVLPDALDPASLRDAIRSAMSMKAGAKRVADAFALAGGAGAAADALERIVVDARVLDRK